MYEQHSVTSGSTDAPPCLGSRSGGSGGSSTHVSKPHLKVGKHLGGGGLEVQLHQELEQVVDLRTVRRAGEQGDS